jgi:glycosyltransferase involved in cell wall biosynthesis
VSRRTEQQTDLTRNQGQVNNKDIDVSFVVIGYNEAPNLRACLDSVRHADLDGIAYELIYVDGGSQDDSIDIARDCGVDQIFGGDRRRRAAENRNLGADHSRGIFIQFLDGDMQLDPYWPKRAVAYLRERPDVAVVCGRLLELNPRFIFQVIQLDWVQREGAVETCGGAALFRRDAFERAGAFPEDVAYGEEPLLCWRIRNNLKMEVHFWTEPMALHDIGFKGFRDYWRQYCRNGATYIEIAARCAGTADPYWTRDTVTNFAWASGLLAAIAFILAGPPGVQLGLLAIVALVAIRKIVQTRRRGATWLVAAGYTAHVYGSKIPLAYGQLRWLVERAIAHARDRT